jgi:putative ABC transport system permease protein
VISEITWLQLSAALVLVAVAIALSFWRGLGLERSIVWASMRAAVQLAAVGLVLAWLLDPGRRLGWSWAWVAVMVVSAAVIVRWRASEIPGVIVMALVAFGCALAVALGVLFGLGIFELEPRTLIPLAGMTIGNSMTATVLVARRIYDGIRDQRDEVEARLALGQPANIAARLYVRQALRTALIPQIESTKAVGLVVLPGAMTGLILAGVEPIDAVKVQLAVMYLILGATATTTTVIALGVRGRLFTRDHRLVPMPRVADG